MRVTFLVNVWLGYTPAGVKRWHPDPVTGCRHQAMGGTGQSESPDPHYVPAAAGDGGYDGFLPILACSEAGRHATVEKLTALVHNGRPPAEVAAASESSESSVWYPVMWVGEEVDVAMIFPPLAAQLLSKASHSVR